MLLAGPSGSGKTHLAQESGLPLLDLDDFYRDGDDPTLPRHPTLGIADWDDPRSWDADAALAAVEAVCRDGAADVPVYDISRDGRTGTRRFDLHGRPRLRRHRDLRRRAGRPGSRAWPARRRRRGASVAGQELPAPAPSRPGRTAQAAAHAGTPGAALLRAEPSVVSRQVELGCRPCDRAATLAALRAAR